MHQKERVARLEQDRPWSRYSAHTVNTLYQYLIPQKVHPLPFSSLFVQRPTREAKLNTERGVILSPVSPAPRVHTATPPGRAARRERSPPRPQPSIHPSMHPPPHSSVSMAHWCFGSCSSYSPEQCNSIMKYRLFHTHIDRKLSQIYMRC